MTEAAAPTRRAVKYGSIPLVALAATVALESGERQSLAQAVDGIQEAFGVSDFAIGFLPTAMALIGVLGSIPMGILADRSRRVWLMGVAMAIWTVCMGFNGLATSYAVLFLFRMGVGAVEANGPAAVSLVADYYPVKDRAKYMGLYQSGALVGALVGLALGGVAVDAGGWRWAFWMWVPFGIVTTVFVLRQPEPRRGEQDEDFEADYALTAPGGTDVSDLANMTGLLPTPTRTCDLDYRTAGTKAVFFELCRIKSMWFGVLSLTISQLLLTGLSFWAVEYFKRVHDLSGAGAGGLAGLLGLSSVFGILGGGFISDRYMRRGIVAARVYVVAIGSVLGTAFLLPAFASTNLILTAILFVFGGVFLTLPVAPAEAMVSDVVVADLRGRAATIRSIVRSVGNFGPLVIGGLSSLLEGGMSEGDALRWAIVITTPVYAIGGVIMLFAARYYPGDVAFVVAESRRRRLEDEGTGVS